MTRAAAKMRVAWLRAIAAPVPQRRREVVSVVVGARRKERMGDFSVGGWRTQDGLTGLSFPPSFLQCGRMSVPRPGLATRLFRFRNGNL